jgi:hypothetical protein
MMTEEQAKAMNEMTVAEARLLYITCGLETVCGNGQLVALCDKERRAEFEEKRVRNDY